jgi:hypothetical protein
VKLGAVDFLSKPLAPLKLRNIWQHTVRKMMCNMNINCSDSAAAAAVDEVSPSACGKPRVSMEVILEETEADLAAAAATAAAAAATAGKPPAPANPAATTPGCSSGGSVINYGNGPNLALAITSSFYEPSKATAGNISRCGSSAMTSMTFEPSSSGSPGPDSPVMDRPTKQQHGQHGPVRSCPSTRSLNSAASCHSSWASAFLPSSPSSEGLQKQGCDAAAAAAAAPAESDSYMEDTPASKACAARCMKKAVRHPMVALGAACKPPLAGKPASQAASAQQQQKPAASSPAPSAGKPLFPAGLASVPLPTGLGPLPTGMVWGMPMCPLVRAPGIVAPMNPSTGAPAAGQPTGIPAMPMAPWGMCGMPMFGSMPPPPFMAGGYGGMMPGMPFPAAPAAAAGFGMGGSFMEPYSQQVQMGVYGQPMWGQPAEAQQVSTGAAAAGPTGASAAAALDASFSAAALLGSDSSNAAQAAAAVAMEEDAFDFMLGDITAEDDLTDVCGGLLDTDLSALAGESIKMPAALSHEMQALEADLQMQAAAAAAAAGRCSMESSAAQRQRVSFDCSTASTCTAARASFEASQRCNSARVSFEASTRSTRVSFEVHSHSMQPKALAPPAAGAAPRSSPVNLKNAASAPAELLGSVSDLFAACSDDSSHGSGLQHVDSCGMLADLQSFFAASGDSCCPQDCADSALTDSSGLFLDPLDDMPIDMGMRKNDSFAELINASLPGLAN